MNEEGETDAIGKVVRDTFIKQAEAAYKQWLETRSLDPVAANTTYEPQLGSFRTGYMMACVDMFNGYRALPPQN